MFPKDFLNQRPISLCVQLLIVSFNRADLITGFNGLQVLNNESNIVPPVWSKIYFNSTKRPAGERRVSLVAMVIMTWNNDEGMMDDGSTEQFIVRDADWNKFKGPVTRQRVWCD